MSDHLLALVPRLCEAEPGGRDSEAFCDFNVGDRLLATDCMFDPLSRRWLGKPTAIESTDTYSGWTCPEGKAIVGVTNKSAGGAGVEITGETYTLKRNTGLTVGRGFWLDLWPYEPASSADFAKPLTITWGGISATSPAKWRLELLPSEAGPGLAILSEHNGIEFKERTSIALLQGKFFNQLHRLWWQPLDGDEFLLSNRDASDLGVVARTEHPYTFDPDAGSTTDDGPPLADAPWGPGALSVAGTGRCWLVYRDLAYPASWSLQTKGPRDLGYPCTQDVTKASTYWLPDGKRVPDDKGGSAYSVAVQVFEGELVEGQADPDEWVADLAGQQQYGWRVTVTGPAEVSALSKRTVCLSRLELSWPRTLASDGSTPVDLIGHPTILLTGLSEQRSYCDKDSTLSFTMQGPLADLRSLVRPGQRWQWQLDLQDGILGDDGLPLGEQLYCRFDGLRDAADAPRWHTVEGEWKATVRLTLRTRWRQADAVLFRGQAVLDGLKRSQAYEQLISIMPLDSTEIAAWDGIDDDKEIPAARAGEQPLFRPEIGKSLSDLIWGLRDVLGPRDRLMFRDLQLGDGPQFVADQPTPSSQATFYRTQSDADAAGVPGQVIAGDNTTGLLAINQDDSEFFNEIVVVGQAPAPTIPAPASDPSETDLPKRGAPLMCYFADPQSWRTAEFGGGIINNKYVGARRTLVRVDPQLNTQAAVDELCTELVSQYYRFRSSGKADSHLVPELYPGDVLKIDPGTEPGATADDYEIRGMTTTLVHLSLPKYRRYRTSYEIGEVPA